MSSSAEAESEEEKSVQLKTFIFLTVFLAPFVSVHLGLGFSSLVVQSAPFQNFSKIDKERPHVVS
ncbi:hypothetical protein [Shewanella atlantica]|uniref:hypothetical protein n=1 Tax=Shewanella atlantica TaxID=271099 RepID=UPI001639EB4F|nr:hypothetical protein [Shewanella atlantica]